MQLENSNDKIKLRIIWILLAAAIVLNIIGIILAADHLGDYYNDYPNYYSSTAYQMDILWDIIAFLPYVILLVEVAFVWEKDKRHIGVFIYLVLQTISSCFFFVQSVNTISAVVLWIGVIVLFCEDFQKCYFHGLPIPKYLLVFALLVTTFQSGYLHANMLYFASGFTLLSVLLSVFAVYLLFDNFSFAPPFQKVDPIKNELELLQKKYELGILSEEEYQQKRQDIISRI